MARGIMALKKFEVTIPVVYREFVEIQAPDRKSAIGRAVDGDGTLLKVDRQGYAGGGIAISGDHGAVGVATPLCFVSFHVHHRLSNERRARLLSRWLYGIIGKGWAPIVSTASWYGFYGASLEGLGPAELLSLSLAELSRVEAALFLPDWEKSERSRAEHEYAEANGILIYEYANLVELRRKMPCAQEFKEKYVAVTIVRDFGHAV